MAVKETKLSILVYFIILTFKYSILYANNKTNIKLVQLKKIILKINKQKREIIRSENGDCCGSKEDVLKHFRWVLNFFLLKESLSVAYIMTINETSFA